MDNYFQIIIKPSVVMPGEEIAIVRSQDGRRLATLLIGGGGKLATCDCRYESSPDMSCPHIIGLKTIRPDIKDWKVLRHFLREKFSEMSESDLRAEFLKVARRLEPAGF